MQQEKDFTMSFVVDKSTAEVYNAINNVRGWWQGEVKGNTVQLNDEFTYQMEPYHFTRQKIVALVPQQKIKWLVTECKLSFVKKADEWTGTIISFDIQPEGAKTKLIFTHHGLVPSIECYGGCSGGWTKVIGKSLYSFINTGKGVDVFN